jgi:transposase-like protein
MQRRQYTECSELSGGLAPSLERRSPEKQLAIVCINQLATSRITSYQLAVCLLTAGHAVRERKRRYKDMDNNLFNRWDDYDAGC